MPTTCSSPRRADGEIYLKARGDFAQEMAEAGAVQFATFRADGSRGH
ncbi:MAG: hypothetical protein R3D59_16940 [Paracoccaceae bacterium]